MAKTRVPAVAGLFTLEPEPRLIGSRGRTRGSYFFPSRLAGSDPGCLGDEDRDEVLFGRYGRIWSYTTLEYAPPPPYPQTDPFVPFVLAAVELDDEKLVVLGQMEQGTRLEDLRVGLPVELILALLYEDDEHEYMVWKWRLRAGPEAATEP